MNTPQKVSRIFSGEVVSDAMDKTIVVKVSRTKVHPKYKKRYISSKNYLVHDEANAHHVGEEVSFVQTRPLSRHKRWRVAQESHKPLAKG